MRCSERLQQSLLPRVFQRGDFFHDAFTEALEDDARVAVSALVLKFTRSILPA